MKKMNGLFVAAFVLALVGMACALGAMTLAYLVKNIELAVLAGAGGALCVFVVVRGNSRDIFRQSHTARGIGYI